MPVTHRQATAVRPRRGGQVHITSLTTPRKTACGRPCDSWIVAIDHVDCRACKAAVFLRVK